jgi:hypothetical protein
MVSVLTMMVCLCVWCVVFEAELEGSIDSGMHVCGAQDTLDTGRVFDFEETSLYRAVISR